MMETLFISASVRTRSWTRAHDFAPGPPDGALRGSDLLAAVWRQGMDNASPVPWAGDEFRMIFASERLSVWMKESCALVCTRTSTWC